VLRNASGKTRQEKRGKRQVISPQYFHFIPLKHAQLKRTMSAILGIVNTETAASQSHDDPPQGGRMLLWFFHFSQPANRVVYGNNERDKNLLINCMSGFRQKVISQY